MNAVARKLSSLNKTLIYSIAFASIALILVIVTNFVKVPTYVGEIFGKKISFEQFTQTYRHKRIQGLLQYGEMFDKLGPLLDLESQTWDSLILLHEAKKKKIKVPDQELIDTIVGYKIFQRNNKFDKNLYNSIIQAVLKSGPREFEESIRQSLLISKLYDQITSAIAPTPEEAAVEYKRRNEKIQFSYILFPLDDYKKDIVPTDDEIKNYYQEHKADFRKSASINVEYVHLNFPKDGGVQKEVEMKYKAKAIVDTYAKTPDFKAAAAKQHFRTKESGYFSKEDPNFNVGWTYDLLIEAFNMAENEIHEPVEMPKKGYLVFRVKGRKNAYLPEFSEVQEKVKNAVITKKAQDAALAKSRELSMKIHEQWDQTDPATRKFADIATGLNRKAQQTSFTSRSELQTFTFRLDKTAEEKFYALNEVQAISEPLLTAKGYVILHVDQFAPTDPQKFEKGKAKFWKQLVTQKKEEIFEKFIQDLTTQANLQKFPSLKLKEFLASFKPKKTEQDSEEEQ